MSQQSGHIAQGGPNPLLPDICRIISISVETPNVKTFRVQSLAGGRPFTPLPGQIAMLTLFGVGEAMFSVSGQGPDYLDFTIKRCGLLTQALHEVEPGQTVGLRGPYGNHFPVEHAVGKDLLFIAGGVGLAPLRSFICHALLNRTHYGNIDVVFGARSPEDILFRLDLSERWPKEPRTRTHITVDTAATDWQGQVGLVPEYLRKLDFAPDNRLAIVCGPPVMMRLTMDALLELDFAPSSVYATLERRMKCGVGTCGRCNIGEKYVCLDGPVFSLAELEGLRQRGHI